MSCRPGYYLLPMLLGLSGCAKWQCCFPQMCMPTHVDAPIASGSSELTTSQAAQLCTQTGEALEKQGYTAEAIRQYENARAHDPQIKLVSRRLALLYDKQGDPQRAESEYLQALQEQSGDAELLNDFGYFHYRHDHLQVAENWLRNAVTINPNLPCAWVNLGQVLARQGRIEESYQAFARVLRPAEAYSNLGVLLAKQGRTVEARSALQQAVSLDPSLEQPRAFLKALPASPSLLPPGIAQKAPPSKEQVTASAPAKAASPPSPRGSATAGSPSVVLNLRPVRSLSEAAAKSAATIAPRTAAANPPTILPTTSAVQPVSTEKTTAKTANTHSATSSDGPLIVHGPVRPLPVENTTKPKPSPASDLPIIVQKNSSCTAAPRPANVPPASNETSISRTNATSLSAPRTSPPPPPLPPPPPPLPAIPLSMKPADSLNDSHIIRTRAESLDSPVVQAGLKTTAPVAPAPSKLQPTAADVKLLPVPATPKPAPRATIIDCQGVVELDN